MLDDVYSRPDLPADVLAVKAKAYAAFYIQCAMILDSESTAGVGGPSRFAIEDRYGPKISAASLDGATADRLALGRLTQQQARRLEVFERLVAEQRATISALEALLGVPSVQDTPWLGIGGKLSRAVRRLRSTPG